MYSKTPYGKVARHSIYVDLKLKLENYLWRRSEPIQTRYSLTIDIQKLLVVRWRASPSSCFDKSFLKILCSEVASH